MATDQGKIGTCLSLIQQSTADSQINTNLKVADLLTLIKKGWMALWLKDGSHVTIAFHALAGPLKNPPSGRHPKFCVCVGIDTKPASSLNVTDEPYKSIRAAVSSFAQNNKVTPLYMLVDQEQQPTTADWVYPIMQCAIKNDVASGEPVDEDYSTQSRWPAHPRSWKFRT